MEPAHKPPNPDVSFYEGRPIQHFSDDELGRKEFARFFAEAITRHHGRESLVLSVNAPWGDGKTSFKNMVVDLLTQEHSERVVTLTFTPWEWASQNQVSEAFFSELAKQLEVKDSSQQAKEAAQRFRALGRYLGLTGHVSGPAGLLLEPLLPGSTILTIALGKGFGKAREVVRNAAEEMERAAEDAKKSLPKVKDDLRAALEDYGQQRKKLILVIIDDIDRLSPEEIRLVFQMVRINADFPALVFLLLYDEKFVVNALSKYFGSDSQRFLEKIVQFQTGLPVLIDNRLRDHVAVEVKKILLARPAYHTLFDLERFEHLWTTGLAHYITNLRQSGRLLSSFEFHLGVFRSDEAEVHPLDFLVLEVFRLFEQPMYRALHAQGDRLFPSFDEIVIWQAQEKEDGWEKRIDEFVGNITDANRPAANRLLKELFPQQGLGNTIFWAEQRDTEAARNRRLCHILYFNRYFRLAIDTDDIPDARITELVKSTEEAPRLIDNLRSLADEQKLPLALTKLLTRDNLRASAQPTEMVGALCDFAETLREISQPKHLIRVIEALKQLVELQLPGTLNSSERLQRLSAGIQLSSAVHLPVQLAEAEDQAEHYYSKANEFERRQMTPRLNRDDVQQLNTLVAERFEERLRNCQVRIANSWVASMTWYLHFMRQRAQNHATDLVRNANTISVVLMVVVPEQSVEQYKHGIAHFAQVPMFLARDVFAFSILDDAIDKHERELRTLGENVAKRIDIYRDMRKKFSDVPQPDSAKSDEES